VIEVASLFIYPVKGLAGVECDRFDLDPHGPRYDREWMLVDPEGVFVSQREEPRLALVVPDVDVPAGVLRLRSGEGAPLEVPLAPDDRTDRTRDSVRVWKDTQPALDEGDAAAAWLAARLGRPLRLVRVPPDHARAVPAVFTATPATTRFTDAFPLLVIGEASLDALNARLDEPVGIRRFRPNIVTRGAAAHAEDRWRRIRIGGAEGPVLAFAKCCARCQVTTIDPDTAVIAPRGEPLRTLATYRTFDLERPDGRKEHGVFFGANYVHEGPGAVGRGDAVTPLE
jgi:uncharacterized protein YcbX